MIIDFIMNILTSVFTGIFGLFPSFTLPASITSFSTSLGTQFSSLNGVLPITAVGVCVGILISVRLFLLAFNVVVWVYDKIPLKAT